MPGRVAPIALASVVLMGAWSLPGTQHVAPARETAISSETPVWSPDGRRLAFSAGPWMRHQIYVIDADGSGARRLTEGEQNRWPSWSPDGRSIVFMSDRDGQGELLSTRCTSWRPTAAAAAR